MPRCRTIVLPGVLEGGTVPVDEEPARWDVADRGVEQDAGAFAVGTEPLAVARSETNSGVHTSRLGPGGGCRTVPATPGSLLKQMSNCWDCFEGLPVAPIDEESGRSGWEWGWCST